MTARIPTKVAKTKSLLQAFISSLVG